MTDVEQEIASQPQAWSRVAQLLSTVDTQLPRPGERVAVVGCGTSWFVAEAYAVRREELGQGETDFFTPADLPAGRRYDRIVAISRSGTTTEVLRLVDAASAPTVAITLDGSAPIVAAAGSTIVLDFVVERAVVQTVFATTALMLLRASLGEDIAPAIGQAERILADPADLGLDATEQFTFLGQGWVHGVAREAALKMREAAQAWTEAYPQLEYRHGPISIAQPGRVVWILGEPVPDLAADVQATGATLVCDDLDPVADLVRVQRLAARIATNRGLDPDHPRHLTRSVVLA